jgi:hypothetical protein
MGLGGMTSIVFLWLDDRIAWLALRYPIATFLSRPRAHQLFGVSVYEPRPRRCLDILFGLLEALGLLYQYSMIYWLRPFDGICMEAA